MLYTKWVFEETRCHAVPAPYVHFFRSI